uniref:Uncharacterized protein n=1 Tax=Rhizophora mucronata TaxID=61149 RepID=A0A2P2P4D3_RHIMU
MNEIAYQYSSLVKASIRGFPPL